jgi:D-3-phosphoglycerate dehydrogenase / 2-oxoglutarate reductase
MTQNIKILVCDPTESSAIERIQSGGMVVDVDDQITPVGLLDIIGNYDGMVVRSRTKVTAKIIDAAQKLQIIVRGGVGLDTIDVEYARAKNITVMNTPLASSAAVAELTIGYLFALARQIPQATASMQAGRWDKKKFEGEEISGKNLGIVGIGNIGKEVAWRANHLGMHVFAYDPYVTSFPEVSLLPFAELLACADYLTFHLPLNSQTRGMVGKDEFEKMKPGVRIINCARGGIIDEDALFEALQTGKVAGAALDVFAEEPSLNNRLFTLGNVVGSPHIGASTREAQGRIGTEIADILLAFFNR